MKEDQKPIKNALSEFLDKFRLSEPLARHDIAASWEQIMGKTIARHTLKIYIRQKTLYIHVDSSVLRSELDLGKSKIIKLVNEHTGRVIVDDVVLL
jgi:predicted nucleic acid-binding Zn ribbon protein